jgi:nicotinamidase-related amidase
MATEIRVDHTQDEGKDPKYGYVIIRDGVAEKPSAFKYKDATEATDAGLKAAEKADKAADS